MRLRGPNWELGLQEGLLAGFWLGHYTSKQISAVASPQVTAL